MIFADRLKINDHDNKKIRRAYLEMLIVMARW